MTITELEKCIDIYGKDIYGFCRQITGSAQEGENMKRNDYYISVGADSVSENKVTCVVWFQDGVKYSIMNIYGTTPAETLFEMAGEIIAN